MVFKNKLFFSSSKKSETSSPDGSNNSPRSIGSNSPIRSDKKKGTKSKDSTPTTPTSTGSSSNFTCKQTQVKDGVKKKDSFLKGKETVNQPQTPTIPGTSNSRTGLKSKKGGVLVENKEKEAEKSSVSPILASSLRLNRIKTRSGPLPQESFFSFRGDKGSGLFLPDPYYWWEAGAMFMNMIEYWFYTGDTTYNDETIQAIVHQAGPKGGESFVPSNQSKSEGNDDQIFWAFSAMNAAELNFPSPPDDAPSWAAMAQSVFNGQANRWDDQCDGGLRWQMFAFNNGYNYKNVAANGGFFLLTSKLARYTGNTTFVDWAEKQWDWFSNSVLYQADGFQVNDGTDISNNCTVANDQQWSYNYGFYVAGLAYMYNHTQDAKWLTPLKGLVTRTFTEFFPTDDIIVEEACEPVGNCDTNGFTFKGYTVRWLGITAQLVPELADQIWPYLEASGKAAAGQCSGGADGNTCGMKWTQTTWDGSYGVGQQMSALSAVGVNMLRVGNLKAPYTRDTGGESIGDPNAGTDPSGSTEDQSHVLTDPITTGDKAGAGILTALVLAFTLGGAYYLIAG